MNTDDILYKYWEYALPRIKEINPELFLNTKPLDRNAMNGRSDCGIEFVCLANQKKRNIPANTVAVELYIDGSQEDRNRIKKQYDYLESKKSEIEARIPGLFWNRNTDKRASSIICFKQLDYTDERNWKECAEFHATMIKKLYECAFLPYRKELADFMLRRNDSGNTSQRITMLSSVMAKYGLNPETTKLVRHSYSHTDMRKCYEKGFLEAYQSIQKSNVFHGCTHILSFIGTEGTSAVFFGLYEVLGEYMGNHQARMPEGYPLPEEFLNDRYYYDLVKVDSMADLEGKLKIEWGNSTIQWCQNATTDKEILECPKYNASVVRHKMVFCNIAYMKYYDTDIAEPAPTTGGSFVKDNGFGFERNNFHVYQEPCGVFCKGFVETGHSGEMSTATTSKQLNISRIDSKGEMAGTIDGVTVVFCAIRPGFGCVVVGWYRNAKAFKCVQKDESGNLYRFLADSRDCVLLDEDRRVFKVPRSGREGSSFGFGRFNVWYADDEASREYVSKTMKYIVKSTEKPVEDSDEDTLSTEEQTEYIESGTAKKTVVNSYERNQKARRECLRIHGTDCFVCGFNSAKVYGSDYENKIEVHHIIPISKRGGDYKVNPETDLIPVCPNCHGILHTKNKDGKTLGWEELKARIKK